MEPLYKHLDESEIRLLTIISHDDVTAELELRTYSRDEAPEYDAVSYTWGDDESTTSVYCNGLPLRTRTTLFRALPYIHKFRPGPQRPLWIDAMCLDQKDDIEKALHVPLIGSIYKKATRTLVWLGEAADDSDLAIDSMSDLTQRMLEVDPDECLKAYLHYKDLKLVGLPHEHDPVWKSFLAIQLRPWYFRLWTLQEIVFANEPLMLCGIKNMPWGAITMLRKAARRANLIPLVFPDEPSSRILENIFQTIAFTHHLRTQVENHNAMRFDEAIQCTMNRQYTEPVDRIWAILALLRNGDQELLVKANLIKYGPAARMDYHQTYLGIMRLYIEQNPVVGMKLFEAGLSQVHNPKLPSWCPDWHLKCTSTPFSYMNNLGTVVKAGFPQTIPNTPRNTVFPSGRLHPTIPINDILILIIPGFILDIVQTTTSTAGTFWTFYNKGTTFDIARVTQSSKWLRECLDTVNSNCQPSTSSDLTPGLPSEEIPDPGLYPFNTLEGYMKQLTDLLSFEDATQPYYWVITWCAGRKFFRTKTGQFGLGPHDLEEGDLVCALFAGAPLFVLRPVESQGGRKQRYRVVGDAYVPGLMQGEGFRGKQLDEMQEFHLV